jgi:hypothetical protein
VQRKSTRVGHPVRVTWEDAWFTEEYHSSEYMEAESGKEVITYGLCISDTKKGLSIAMDVCPGEDRYRDIKFVPTGMLRQVKVLR